MEIRALKIEKDGDTYRLIGHLIGTSDLDAIDTSAGFIRLDMSGVGAVTSCGTRDLIRWLRTSGARPIYIRCSPSFVTQFNLVTDLLRQGAMVESVLLRFECPACNDEIEKICISGKDFFPGKITLAIESPRCLTCGSEMEPEYDIEDYFCFTENLGSI